MMPPLLRKAMLTLHIATSVGWLGAVCAYIALNAPIIAGADENTSAQPK